MKQHNYRRAHGARTFSFQWRLSLPVGPTSQYSWRALIGHSHKVPPPLLCCALIGRASHQLGAFPPFQRMGAWPKLRSLTCSHHNGDGGGVGRRSRFFSPRVSCSLRAGRRSLCGGGLLGPGAGGSAAQRRVAGAAAAANRGRWVPTKFVPQQNRAAAATMPRTGSREQRQRLLGTSLNQFGLKNYTF